MPLGQHAMPANASWPACHDESENLSPHHTASFVGAQNRIHLLTFALLPADIHGWKFRNTRLIADAFAAEGYLTILPDFFHGDEFPSEPQRPHVLDSSIKHCRCANNTSIAAVPLQIRLPLRSCAVECSESCCRCEGPTISGLNYLATLFGSDHQHQATGALTGADMGDLRRGPDARAVEHMAAAHPADGRRCRALCTKQYIQCPFDLSNTRPTSQLRRGPDSRELWRLAGAKPHVGNL